MRRILFLAILSSALTARAQTVTIGATSEVCKVSNSDVHVGGQNQLDTRYQMFGADLGYTVWDGTNTWVLFGDTLGNPPAWHGGADAMGYFAGRNPQSLCGSLSLVAASGQTISNVFSADVMLGPSWGETIDDFVFDGASPTAGATQLDAAYNAAVPGDDEVPSGAFMHNGQMYIFFSGNPYHSHPSVSYLATWTPTTTPTSTMPKNPATYYPTTYQVLSKVDYNYPAKSPQAPSGWIGPPGPMGGLFIKIAPVVPGDGYLYLYGTSPDNQSNVSLARLPVSSLASLGPYLASAPTLQVWNGSGWSSSLSDAAPVASPATPGLSNFSVRYYSEAGLWLMMYTLNAAQQVIVRWSADGLAWSPEQVLIDLTADAATYCCTGPTYKDHRGNRINQCSGDQMVQCTGAFASTIYAPFLLPNVSNISIWTSTSGTLETITTSFTAHYQLSAFTPYVTTLMSFPVTSVTTTRKPLGCVPACLDPEVCQPLTGQCVSTCHGTSCI